MIGPVDGSGDAWLDRVSIPFSTETQGILEWSGDSKSTVLDNSLPLRNGCGANEGTGTIMHQYMGDFLRESADQPRQNLDAPSTFHPIHFHVSCGGGLFIDLGTQNLQFG